MPGLDRSISACVLLLHDRINAATACFHIQLLRPLWRSRSSFDRTDLPPSHPIQSTIMARWFETVDTSATPAPGQGLRTITPTEVARHARVDDCWLIYQARVYDCSEFIYDHPGGEDLILQFAGKEIRDGVLDDPLQHVHSNSAYLLMEEFLIGKVPEDHVTCSRRAPIPAPSVVRTTGRAAGAVCAASDDGRSGVEANRTPIQNPTAPNPNSFSAPVTPPAPRASGLVSADTSPSNPPHPGSSLAGGLEQEVGSMHLNPSSPTKASGLSSLGWNPFRSSKQTTKAAMADTRPSTLHRPLGRNNKSSLRTCWSPAQQQSQS